MGKKILVMFLAIIFILNIYSIVANSNKTDTMDLIFFDDFNDNVIDYSKWSEYESNNGSWKEINGRTEFTLFEQTPEGTGSGRAIKSTEFQVELSNDIPITLSCDIISDIEHNEDWQWIGGINIIISDGANFIKLEYSRAYNELRYWDSNDEEVYIFPLLQEDGYWNNQINLFNNRYSIKMNEQYSNIIYDSLFSDNPKLHVILKTYISGDYPHFWWRAGFDNVFVYSQASIPTVKITYPKDDEIIDVSSIDIEGIAHIENGEIDKVEVKIDDGYWQLAMGTDSWTYFLDIAQLTTGEQHIIYARSISDDITSLVDIVTIYVGYKPPEITIVAPNSGLHFRDNEIWFNGEYSHFPGNVESVLIEIFDIEENNSKFSDFAINGSGIWSYRLNIEDAMLEEKQYLVKIVGLDDEGNSAIDNIVIIIDKTKPTNLQIIAPQIGYLYMRDWGKLLPFFYKYDITSIIGNFNFRVTYRDEGLTEEMFNKPGFEPVCISIRNNRGVEIISSVCKMNGLFEAFEEGKDLSYSWKWSTPGFGRHTIEITARDLAGNTKTDSIPVWKLF